MSVLGELIFDHPGRSACSPLSSPRSSTQHRKPNRVYRSLGHKTQNETPTELHLLFLLPKRVLTYAHRPLHRQKLAPAFSGAGRGMSAVGFDPVVPAKPLTLDSLSGRCLARLRDCHARRENCHRYHPPPRHALSFLACAPAAYGVRHTPSKRQVK
eukprot:3446065-Rhodomonas_salina.1